MRGWRSDLFREQMAKRKLSPAGVARAMKPYGVAVGSTAVYRWTVDGSPGPKHPFIHVAAAEALGCGVDDIAPSTEHLERKIMSKLGGNKRGGCTR